MPFVEVMWDPDHFPADGLLRLRDELPSIVARALTTRDPAHLVDPAMVDVRIIGVGPYDRINRSLYVTVLARTEPDRDTHKLAIVRDITDAVLGHGCPLDTLVELILTNRVSVYDYKGT